MSTAVLNDSSVGGTLTAQQMNANIPLGFTKMEMQLL